MAEQITLEIRGSSDDTVGAYGLPGRRYCDYSFDDGSPGAMDDYDTCGRNDPPLTFDVISPGDAPQRVRVTAIYDGCWSFAVGLADEGDDTPDRLLGDVRHKRDDHSMCVTMRVPVGTRVVWNRSKR